MTKELTHYRVGIKLNNSWHHYRVWASTRSAALVEAEHRFKVEYKGQPALLMRLETETTLYSAKIIERRATTKKGEQKVEEKTYAVTIRYAGQYYNFVEKAASATQAKQQGIRKVYKKRFYAQAYGMQTSLAIPLRCCTAEEIKPKLTYDIRFYPPEGTPWTLSRELTFRVTVKDKTDVLYEGLLLLGKHIGIELALLWKVYQDKKTYQICAVAPEETPTHGEEYTCVTNCESFSFDTPPNCPEEPPIRWGEVFKKASNIALEQARKRAQQKDKDSILKPYTLAGHESWWSNRQINALKGAFSYFKTIQALKTDRTITEIKHMLGRKESQDD